MGDFEEVERLAHPGAVGELRGDPAVPAGVRGGLAHRPDRVRIGVIGTRGRHSDRVPAARSTARLAAIGVAVLVAGGLIVGLVLHGSSPPAASAPAAPPTLTTAATPSATARPAAHADPLGTAAASYLAARSGTVLAAVYDLRTGQTWSVGSGPPQAEASVVKLDVLETLLAQRGGGSAGLAPGDRTLAEQMIEDSDNDAATSLWYEVGGPDKIRAFNDAAGLSQTSPSSCVVCPGFAWPGWGLTTTVPDDQIRLLRELVEPGPLLTAADRSYALSLMENVTSSQRWGVSGGVPAGVTVALKNGWLPLDSADTNWQINSVGWISGHGRDYLMAVLTTGNPSEQYGVSTIDTLGALVWRGMS
jgi:beta-lactamase class A